MGVGLEPHDASAGLRYDGGQPQVIASREETITRQAIWTYRSGPMNRISALCLSPHGGGRGHFVGCSIAVESEPEGGRAHGLAERLPWDLAMKANSFRNDSGRLSRMFHARSARCLCVPHAATRVLLPGHLQISPATALSCQTLEVGTSRVFGCTGLETCGDWSGRGSGSGRPRR